MNQQDFSFISLVILNFKKKSKTTKTSIQIIYIPIIKHMHVTIIMNDLNNCTNKKKTHFLQSVFFFCLLCFSLSMP